MVQSPSGVWVMQSVAFKKATTQAQPFVLQQATGAWEYSATSLQVLYPADQTSGDTNIVSVESNEELPVSVTDSVGNSYTLIGSSADNSIATYLAPNIQAAPGGTNAVSVQLQDATVIGVRILEYHGMAACPVDQIAVAKSGTGTTATTNSVATTQAPELLLMTPGWANQGTGPGNSGFRWLDTDGLGETTDWLADRIVTSTGTYSGTMTQTPSGNWDAQLFSFSKVSSAGTPTQLAFQSSPQTAPTTWACSGITTVTQENASGQPVISVSPQTISLSGSGLTFYSDSGCTQPITSVTIPACGGSSASFYFMGATSGSSSITASAGGLTPANQGETVTALAPFTWIGGAGCSGNWPSGAGGSSDLACWSGSGTALPGPGDTAHFDGNCTVNCSPTITGSLDVGGIWLHATDPTANTLALGGQTLVVEDVFEQDGGTFTAAGGSLTVNPTSDLTGFILSGGSFTAPNGSGSFTLANSDVEISGSPTFNANGGTVTFTPGGTTYTYDVGPGLINFNNVTFQANAAALELTGTMNVLGKLTIANDSASYFASCPGATIAVSGDVAGTSGDSDDPYECTGGGNEFTTLALVGSGTQNFSASGNALPGNIVISSTGSVNLSGSITVADTWTYTSGTVNAGTSTVTFLGQSANATLSPGSAHFNNVGFGDGANGCENPTIVGTMYVDGNATVNLHNNSCNNTLAGGTLSVAGNLSVGSFTNPGSAGVTFTGGNAQTFTTTSPIVGNILVAKTPGSVLSLGGNFGADGASITVSSGVFNLNGHNLTGSPALTVSDTVELQGGETVTLASATFNSGSTAIYLGNGSSTYTSLKLGNTYDSLTFNNSGNTWKANAAVTINKNLTVTAGTFDTNAHNLTVAGNIAGPGTLTNSGSAKTLTFAGTSQSFNDANAIGNLNVAVSSGSALTLNSGLTTTAGETFTVSSGGTTNLNGNAINVGSGSGTITVSGTMNCNGGCGNTPILSCDQNSSAGLTCLNLGHAGTINP